MQLRPKRGFRRSNPKQRLGVSGHDEDGSVRIVELAAHPFFIATLFVPQVISSPGKPHPLIMAYLEAAAR